jgi:hypothetical protein
MAQVRLVQIGTAQPGTNIQIGTIGRTLTAAPAGLNIQLGKFNNTTGTFYRDPTNPSAGGAGQQIQVGTNISNRTLGYIIGTGAPTASIITTQTLPGAGYFSIWNAGAVQGGFQIQVPNCTGQQAKATGSQSNQPAVNQAAVNQAAKNQPLVNQPLVQQAAVNQAAVNQAAKNQPLVNQPLNQQAAFYYPGVPANYVPGYYIPPQVYPGTYYPAYSYDSNGDGFHNGYQRYEPAYNAGGNYVPGNYVPPQYYPGVASQYYPGKNQPLVNQPLVQQAAVNQAAVNQAAKNQPLVNQPLVNQAAVNQAAVNQAAVITPSTNQAATGLLYNGSWVNTAPGTGQNAGGFVLTIPNIGTLTTQGGAFSGTGAGGSFQFPGTYTRTASAAVSTQQGIVNFQGTTRN